MSFPVVAADPVPPVLPVPDPVVTGPAGLVFLADGITLHSATITATGYTEVGSAMLPSTDLATGHQIFGLVVHPNKRWIYVASETQAWTNARLSRFAVDWATGALTYVDSTLMTAAPGPDCATNDNCAPVGLGITSDGTRLIVEENSNDTFHTYSIATDGALTYETSAALNITSMHGVGINAAGSYLYHGSRAYSRTGDTITALNNSGSEDGNASVVLTVAGAERLYTTLNTTQVAVLSLADPTAPAVIASVNPDPLSGSDTSLFMDVTKDGSRLLAVGDRSVAILDFDGTTLTVRNQLAVTGRARGAALNADASLAVVTFQTGGAKLYTVAADGTLAEVAAVPSPNPTRAVVFSTRP